MLKELHAIWVLYHITYMGLNDAHIWHVTSLVTVAFLIIELFSPPIIFKYVQSMFSPGQKKLLPMNFVCLFAMAFAHAAHVHISQVR